MSYTFLPGCRKRKDENGKWKDWIWDKFECIRVNIGSFKMEAEIIKRNVGEYKGVMCVLKAPICANIGDKVGICRKGKKKEWAFVGGGIIRKTKNIFIQSDYDKLQRCNAAKSMKLKPNINAKNGNGTHEGNEEKYERKDNNKQGAMIVGVGRKSIGAIHGSDRQMVHINYQQRNGRKGVTTIVGLPEKVNFKKLKTKIKKMYGTGATIVDAKDSNGNINGKVLQVQGDLRKAISEFIVRLNIVEKEQIIIHGA